MSAAPDQPSFDVDNAQACAARFATFMLRERKLLRDEGRMQEFAVALVSVGVNFGLMVGPGPEFWAGWLRQLADDVEAAREPPFGNA